VLGGGVVALTKVKKKTKKSITKKELVDCLKV
jgi:hypothetical protein